MSGLWQLLGMMAPVALTSSVPELSAYATLTTDYVFRGISQSDEKLSVQLGMEAEFDSGWFVGAWGATTDLTTGGRRRDRQVDFFLGYVHEFGGNWALGTAVNRYTYPGSGGDVDYDYNEFAVFTNINDRLWLELSYTRDLFGHEGNARTVEIITEWPISKQLVLDAGAGHFDVLGDGASDYTYWQTGLSRPLGRFNLDLRFHDTSRTPAFTPLPGLADARLVFSVSTAF